MGVVRSGSSRVTGKKNRRSGNSRFEAIRTGERGQTQPICWAGKLAPAVIAYVNQATLVATLTPGGKQMYNHLFCIGITDKVSKKGRKK